MDDQRFDDLARSFARGVSRRRMLKALAGGAAAGGLAMVGHGPVDAAKGGNSACAQWCAANFSGWDQGHCTSQAAQGDGPCNTCGPAAPNSGLTLCGGGCVDLSSDGNNCGDCGATCDETQTCSDGSCACDSALLDGWDSYARGVATVAVVRGNGAPGYSARSVQLTRSSTSDKAYIHTTNYNGTALADFDSLTYRAHVASAPGPQVLSINIFLDSGDGVPNGYITYEPYIQGSPQDGSNITADAWQEWDARAGL